MPTYEYACSSCERTHEIQQKMTDPTLTDCPECGQPTLRKVFTNVGVVFKGSGFYRTDSRGTGSSSAASGASSGSTSGSSGSGDGGSSSSSTSSTTSSTSSTSSTTGTSSSTASTASS